MKTDFKIDGNGKGIMLDGKALKRRQKITVSDGKLRVGIQTRGGKSWGWINRMTITKFQQVKL